MRILISLLLCLMASAAFARGEKSGEFDYYVLALSWSPTFCAIEGDRRGNPQCDTDAGWVLHGLWPQYERGWPSYCPTTERAPSRSMTNAMVDIMGSSGSAWHQWNKHGTCAGTSAADYYDQARFAYDQVVRPQVFRKLPRPVEIPALLVEEAFLKDNPDLTADGLTVTCKQNRVQEVQICLTKGLTPRTCGADVRRDCTMSNALMDPVR